MTSTGGGLVIYLALFVVGVVLTDTDEYATQSYVESSNNLSDDNYEAGEKVKVVALYESLCPDCIEDYASNILPTVQQLNSYMELNTYPYGNARMSTDAKGNVIITCQHGEAECYGNRLHACAIDILKSTPLYVNYIACLMPLHSNDAAADECGQQQNVDSESIKKCAKSDRGFQLHKYYGELTSKFAFSGVPTLFVNGNDIGDQPLSRAVCNALKNPPKECS